MLMHLHVKNFALIEEADMEFGAGLNILTGETGAGKSILIDAVNLALGGKAGANVIRSGAEYAYIELVFQVEEEEKLRQLQPDKQERWLSPLYRIYLNLNLVKEFDEIDALMKAKK